MTTAEKTVAERVTEVVTDGLATSMPADMRIVEELDLDHIDVYGISIGLEDEFSIDLSQEENEALFTSTFADVIALIERKLAEQT